MELKRYRWTPAMFDVPFLFGATAARALTNSSLVALLEGMGHKRLNARNMLTRMKEIGSLSVEVQGSVEVCRIATPSAQRFDEVEGTAKASQWNGWFGAIVYNVPESHRTLRDRLVHTATNAGYGVLRPGVMIAAGDRWSRVRIEADEFTDATWVFPSALTPSSIADARDMARRAWNLDAIASAYRRASARITETRVEDVASWEAVLFWRDIYFLARAAQFADPYLPSVLLPRIWPAVQFRTALDTLNSQVGPPLLVHLRTAADGHDPSNLNEYYLPPWI